MARKISYIIIGCWMFLVGVVSAAQPPQARQLLNRASEAFRQAGGMEASFTYSTGMDPVESDGKICLQGQQFVLSAAGIETWFDGRTQWSYVVANEEVNITEPTAEELQGLNPYAWLTLYREGCSLSLVHETKQSYQVSVVPTRAQHAIREMLIELDKQTYYPLSVKIQYGMSDCDFTYIRIRQLKTKQRFAEGFFKFDAQKHPRVEIIDLR